MTNTNKTLSPKEAAAELGCHIEFLLAEIRGGSLPAVRVNRRVLRIDRRDLDAYRRARTVGSISR